MIRDSLPWNYLLLYILNNGYKMEYENKKYSTLVISNIATLRRCANRSHGSVKKLCGNNIFLTIENWGCPSPFEQLLVQDCVSGNRWHGYWLSGCYPSTTPSENPRLFLSTATAISLYLGNAIVNCTCLNGTAFCCHAAAAPYGHPCLLFTFYCHFTTEERASILQSSF